MKTRKGKYVEGTVDEINALFAGKSQPTRKVPMPCGHTKKGFCSDECNRFKPSASEHTPGPWKVSHLNAGQVMTSTDGYDASIRCYGSDGYANARLIAAAPELLSRLKTAMAYMEAKSEQPDWVSETRTIIAKAEGTMNEVNRGK
jgi:hypothetical protein